LAEKDRSRDAIAAARCLKGVSVEERQLVADARAGSREAAARLFEEHWDGAWQTAYRVTGRRGLADDIAQDAFITALTRLDSFRGESTFGTWLFRIVVNRALTVLRTEATRATLDDLPVYAADEHIESAHNRELLTAVTRLPLDRRLAIVLRYWLDCSPAEIADLLGSPLGTINSRLARGLAELRLALEVSDVQRC
jgi:RNA polymerase sigma-70 factor (ECF subfamily)